MYLRCRDEARSILTLLIRQGTDDIVVPYSISPAMMQRLRRAKLVTIQGGGHDISNAHADEIGPQIREFLLS